MIGDTYVPPRYVDAHPPPAHHTNPWPARTFLVLVLAFVLFLVYTNPPSVQVVALPAHPTESYVTDTPTPTPTATGEPTATSTQVAMVTINATYTFTPTPSGPPPTPKPECKAGKATPGRLCEWPLVRVVVTPTTAATCSDPNPGFDCIWEGS